MKTWLLIILVLLIQLVSAAGADEKESEAAQWEAVFKRFSERHGITNQSDLTNMFWTNFVRGFIVHPSFGEAWDEIPAPTLTSSNAMKAVQSFVATNGWNMETGGLLFTYGLVKPKVIRGLPWVEIYDREFPALTHNGILYVILRGWHHDCGGVAYNPKTNAFADAIAGFKPLTGHWYVWAQPEDPIRLTQIYEGGGSAARGAPANGSQPIRPETNSTSSATGRSR